MLCEKCKAKMNRSLEGSTQGWRCSVCEWSVITTHIDAINADKTDYSLYINGVTEIDAKKIRFIAKTASVNYVIAKKMLEESACIKKAKAIKIKPIITKMQELEIDYSVIPLFKW